MKKEKKSENLMEGLLFEMNRVRELIKLYETIPAGQFGVAILSDLLKRTEACISNGDVVEMLLCYTELKECE